MAYINDPDTATSQKVDSTPRAARVILYNSSGTPITTSDVAAGATIYPTTQVGSIIAGVGQNDWAPNNTYFGRGTAFGKSALANIDIAGNLATRGQVLTDEESIRTCFPGTSLNTDLTGTVTVTNGSASVTGQGTNFTSFGSDVYLKIKAHAETVWARVSSVESDTALTLKTTYSGASVAGAAHITQFPTITGSGGSVSVADSYVVINSGTTSGSRTVIWRDGDYSPLTLAFSGMLASQRIANQELYFGFQDSASSPLVQVLAVYDGTDNTKIKFRTSFGTDDIEESIITMPVLSIANGGGQITSAIDGVIIEVSVFPGKCTLSINALTMATHYIDIPGPYKTLNPVIGIHNTGVPTTTTTFSCDSIYFANHDRVEIGSEMRGGAINVNISDASGGQITQAEGTIILQATQEYLPVAGIQSYKYIRPFRVSSVGTLRTTAETILFSDLFEGSNVNGWYTQSTSTMTIAQSSGVLTVNNNASTTANAYAILTNQRQFGKHSRQPIFGRFRGKLNSVAAGGHTIVEVGFGTPTGNTAAVTNGAFFRLSTVGGTSTFSAVISYGASEYSTTLTSLPDATRYYTYDIIVDDDNIRFCCADPTGIMIIDQSVSLGTVATPSFFTTSHFPTFIRVYNDSTGGGTAQSFAFTMHEVNMLDVLTNKPWNEQLSSMGKGAITNPVTYAQNAQLALNAAPGAVTPVYNGTAPISTLGGEFLTAAPPVAGSENLLSLFGYLIPFPYTFYLTGLLIPPVLNQGAAVTTTAQIHEWFVAVNASSNNISTATGTIKQTIGILQSAATGTANGAFFTANNTVWTPKTPIVCLPGTYLIVGYKAIVATATANETFRGSVTVDGYFE